MSALPAGPLRVPLPPLGVRPREGGIDVAVHAAYATSVDVCLLFPGDKAEEGRWPYEEVRHPLTASSYGVWWGFIPDVPVGTRYGFRVHGEWNPRLGLRHNPAKLLVDPYARGLVGELSYDESTYGYMMKFADGHRLDGNIHGLADPRDTAPLVPHGVVVDVPDAPVVARPHVPWAQTVVYEAHVRGVTMRHPDLPPQLRGTYAGLGHEVMVSYLKDLGVTTVELLPIQAFVSEPHLIEKGLTNYWGYNTLGFFAPHADYATAAAKEAGPDGVIREVQEMVASLHRAGLEVILDVVYNHTCEGGTGGQHLSWRGLDAPGYYLHDGSTPAQFADVTGCGNTLDFTHPRVVQLALDSMRYWVTTFGVDGFRLDLAVTLGRDSAG